MSVCAFPVMLAFVKH